MEIGLKERLIGAIVLVVLAVIFIPWALRGPVPGTPGSKPLVLPPPAVTAAVPREYRMDLDKPVPPAHTMATTQAAPTPASSPTVTAAAPAHPVKTPPAARLPSSGVSPKPSAHARTVPAAGKWVVQAGSYGSVTNARKVAHTLESHGYHVRISHFRKGGHTYYRVRVGPYADRAAAQRVVTDIAHAYGGRAVVVPNS
ncbi:MAG: SPOR domain-containing protein [Gammaproteobacteria bacterium]|nr:SPOR domain-containing protein [Gammaproteobacteria bacterium]